MWANENPKDDTCSRESNLRTYDCKADTLPLTTGTTSFGNDQMNLHEKYKFGLLWVENNQLRSRVRILGILSHWRQDLFNFSQTANFRVFQTQSVCRRQFQT